MVISRAKSFFHIEWVLGGVSVHVFVESWIIYILSGFYVFLAFIEKNTWSGIEDFYSNLARALHVETTTQPRGGPANSKIRRKTKSQR